jgi:hypothetical protein
MLNIAALVVKIKAPRISPWGFVVAAGVPFSG